MVGQTSGLDCLKAVANSKIDKWKISNNNNNNNDDDDDDAYSAHSMHMHDQLSFTEVPANKKKTKKTALEKASGNKNIFSV